MSKLKKYYHYTLEDTIQKIIDSGQINLAKSYVNIRKEKLVAWVSSNDNWEHSATKLFKDIYGNCRMLTFEEQSEHFGCGRIVVKADGFMTWAKLIYDTKIDKNLALGMEISGRKMGADPSEWFGSLYPIKKDKWISAEIFKDGKWIEVESFL